MPSKTRPPWGPSTAIAVAAVAGAGGAPATVPNAANNARTHNGASLCRRVTGDAPSRVSGAWGGGCGQYTGTGGADGVVEEADHCRDSRAASLRTACGRRAGAGVRTGAPAGGAPGAVGVPPQVPAAGGRG